MIVKINKINILSFGLMLVNAFLSLPILLLNIYKKKESLLLISLFLAILGFFFVPATENYDIARYYQMFENEVLRKSTFNYQNDFYAEYLIDILMYFNLSKNFLAFISAFISYYFLLKCYVIVLDKKNISKISYMFLFFFTYISIPIIGYTGIRFLPALAIFSYGLLSKRKITQLLFPILAIVIHSSFVLCTFLFYFCNIFCRKKVKKNIFLILFSFIFGILFKEKVILEIIKSINELNFVYITPNYILGEWGKGFIESRNSLVSKITNYTFYGLRIFLLIYINILFYKIKFNQKNFVLNNFILSLSCFCLIFYRYFTIFERFSNVVIAIGYFIFLPKYLIKKEYKYNILGSMFFIYFFLNLLYDLKRYYLCFYLSYNNPFKISIFNILVKIVENYI